MPNRTKQTWDRNPANCNTCVTHGPYTGLICTPCITTLPPRQSRTTARYTPRTGGNQITMLQWPA